MGAIFGSDFDRPVTRALKTKVTAEGVTLSLRFLNQLYDHGQAVILLEGRQETTKPLVLSVERLGVVLAEVSLPLSLSPVEQMFRHGNFSLPGGEPIEVAPRLDAPNEGPTNGKNFVFIHGYNVNQQQARGWASDNFKKMWWSGSRAKFYAVTWRGSDTQTLDKLTYDLQINIEHAFRTAPALAGFLNRLQLTGETSTAAHSLGNMLMLAALNPPLNEQNQPAFPRANIARHFAFDAAVAAEAIDGALAPRQEMSNSVWESRAGGTVRKIDPVLWASEWYTHFTAAPADARGQLTWRDKFSSGSGAVVYNFFSDGRLRSGTSALNLGEEVLNYRNIYMEEVQTPVFPTLSQVFELLSPTGENSWYYQEVSKGLIGLAPLLSSDYGGWGFGPAYTHVYNNPDGSFLVLPFTHDEIAAITWTETKIRTEPLFLFNTTKRLTLEPGGTLEPLADLYGPNGSDFARRFQVKLLASMIPARSVAMGREEIPGLGRLNERNFDLSSDALQGGFQDGWPQERISDVDKQRRWLHSDAREVAFRYNHRLFEKWVSLGNLNLP